MKKRHTINGDENMNENEKLLSQINKITQMGQVGINSVMPRAKQPALRQALKVQRTEYDSIEKRAANLAKAKGYQIRNIPGFVQNMSGMMARSRLMTGDTDSKIAGMMIQGNTRGMIQSLKSAHRANDPDPEVAKLSQKLLETEIANIQQMEGFL